MAEEGESGGESGDSEESNSECQDQENEGCKDDNNPHYRSNDIYAKMAVYHDVDEELNESDLEIFINEQHENRSSKIKNDSKKAAKVLKYAKEALKEFYESDYDDFMDYVRRKGRVASKATTIGISDEAPDAIAYTYGKDDIAFDIDFIEKISELASFAGLDGETGIKAAAKYVIAHELYHNAQPRSIMTKRFINEMDVDIGLMELYTEKALNSKGEEREINSKLTHLSYTKYLTNYVMMQQSKGIVPTTYSTSSVNHSSNDFSRNIPLESRLSYSRR
ncbi:hypothetical protein H6503_06330 [Candidatus Woesearchaeota archaeon]|nr:hypothetical protein [Candidatus Woesearchaeota archaeon]